MAFIPDFEIERLAIEQKMIVPYDSNQLNPSSYDVRLSDQLKIGRAHV